ncbi:AGAP013520-PA-like protein [Anopheles sinensis]|uniref:AGAP013520-PA-like protein n=1 Tax=Anopheles sinensis TaxID=74873 RepID=A0A084VV46_ANOSI|nr:AGAP013520-PA-like protein [Anopheles sinensis]
MRLRSLLVFYAIGPLVRAVLGPIKPVTAPLLSMVASDILMHHFCHPFQPVQFYKSREQDTVDAVLRLLRGRCVTNLGLVGHKDPPRTRNVLFFDDPEELLHILSKFSYRRNDYSGRYLLVMTGGCTNVQTLRNIFSELWKLNIVHVNVLVKYQNTSVEVYTYQPYTPKHCGTPSVKLVARFNEDCQRDVRDVDLYPQHRLNNFHNCTLQVGTFEAKPYTILERKVDGFVEISGLEGNLVQLLAQRLQFRINVTEPPNRMQWGTIGPKGNSTGTMELLQDGQVDFIIACMALDVTRNLYLKPGITHYTSRILFAVPQGRPYTAFEKLFRPFRMDIWVMLSVYLVCVVVVVTGFSFMSTTARAFIYGDGARMPLMRAFYLLFGGSVLPMPVRNFPRTLFVLWLLFTFVIRTLYQGSLYLYLQRSATYPPLSTLDEIHRSPLEYHMVSIAKRFFVDRPEIMRRARFIPPALDSLGRMVAGMADRYQDRVVLCPSDMVAYNNRHLKRALGGKMIHVTRDSVTLFPVTIYYQKQSMLTNVFDREVRKISQSGLMHFWVRNYGDYDFHTNPADAAVGPKKLTNAHLAGAYQIFIVALVMSCLMLLVELVSMRVRIFRSVLEFCIR